MPILAQATCLRTVHISPADRPVTWNALEYALDLARQCSPTISLVGIETDVWKVGLLPQIVIVIFFVYCPSRWKDVYLQWRVSFSWNVFLPESRTPIYQNEFSLSTRSLAVK
jgi:hypothetical protein